MEGINKYNSLIKEKNELAFQKEQLEKKLQEFQEKGGSGSFEGNSSVLNLRIKTLENIKEKLEHRVKQLEKELIEKENEVEIMKNQQGKLISANQRMERTVNELQEQLKHFESINVSEGNDNLLKFAE